VRELDDAARSFNLMVEGLREGELIRHTLGRFVPREVALDLLASGGSISPEQLEATVLFADLEKFSQLTAELGPAGIVSVLNEYFSAMVEILEEHQGVVTQFQGDAILATFNVPITNSNHATNAVNAAVRMLTLLQNRTFTGRQLNARIGVSTGSLVAGAVGAVGRLSYTVHGDAVNQVARLETMNKEHGTRLLVSAATVNQTTGFDLRVIGEAAVRRQSRPVTIHTIDDVVAAAAAVSLKNHAPD
jgi:adenylate cyclase